MWRAGEEPKDLGRTKMEMGNETTVNLASTQRRRGRRGTRSIEQERIHFLKSSRLSAFSVVLSANLVVG